MSCPDEAPLICLLQNGKKIEKIGKNSAGQGRASGRSRASGVPAALPLRPASGALAGDPLGAAAGRALWLAPPAPRWRVGHGPRGLGTRGSAHACVPDTRGVPAARSCQPRCRLHRATVPKIEGRRLRAAPRLCGPRRIAVQEETPRWHQQTPNGELEATSALQGHRCPPASCTCPA